MPFLRSQTELDVEAEALDLHLNSCRYSLPHPMGSVNMPLFLPTGWQKVSLSCGVYNVYTGPEFWQPVSAHVCLSERCYTSPQPQQTLSTSPKTPTSALISASPVGIAEGKRN